MITSPLIFDLVDGVAELEPADRLTDLAFTPTGACVGV